MTDVSYFEALKLPVQNSLPVSGEIQDVIANMQMVNIGLNNTNTKCNVPFKAHNITLLYPSEGIPVPPKMLFLWFV